MEDNEAWDALPAPLRTAIEQHTGPVTGSSPGGDGASTMTRLTLHTAGGNVFIKGTSPDADDLRRGRLDLGAALAPFVTAFSPPLLFRVQAAGWDVTGWPALPGQAADLTPGSPHLPLVTALLRKLAGMPAPDVPLRSTREYWDLDDPPGEETLIHTDPHGANFIVDGDRASLIDWGWAMKGPAWVTPARLMPHLIEAGWTPADAEHALTAIPAWASAPPATVTGYAAELARSFEKSYQQRPGNPHRQRWHQITRAWADHREHTTRS